MRSLVRAVGLAALLVFASSAHAAAPQPGPPLTVRKTTGAIRIDGVLDDPGWQAADSITTWFETRVGDNVPPQVRNVGFLTYDDKYFYAGFIFDDPNPESIRAPLGDHDAISSAIDYAGPIIDSRNDGKSAQMFLSGPRGLQYDAISNDVTGEDSSPDFFWDAEGKITATGWTLEIRIPFSSLRYEDRSNPTWGIMLYRNYPRDRRYQFFTNRLPRDVNCFICNESKLSGLSALPQGSHFVIAPFATAGQVSTPETLGDPLRKEDVDFDFGGDLKWNPSATIALDATLNPDFSQIESDVAQISANERFALFFPEKRPFFLEGVDLLSTPLNATYTRRITSPVAGVRATGRTGNTAYTVVATQDEGGGSVIIPGPQGSSFADQEFHSNVGIARVRHDLGASFVSLLANSRDFLGGTGWNRVFGPDFNWRPKPSENIKGQFLFSQSRTPNRPDLAEEWDGRDLNGHAFQLDWSHSTPKIDWFVAGQDITPEFRADNGFMPQVGYREAYTEFGYTRRPKTGFISRQRIFTINYADFEIDANDRILVRRDAVGTGLDGKLNSFMRLELNWDALRVGDELLKRFRPYFFAESSPGRVLNYVSFEAYLGDEIDFANAREAKGMTLNGSVSVRPSDHLELRGNVSRRWIDVETETAEGRLFTAEVERLRATYSFTSRAFLRLIGQYVQTKRRPDLYTFAVDEKSAGLSGSALFAYKLNWQTVMYLGVGNDYEYSPTTDELENSSLQWFTKVSYAIQR